MNTMTHPDFTNYYATDDGRVFSTARKTVRELKPTLINSGYYKINVSQNGTNKTMTISRFMYECFNGPVPDDMHVDHIDGDRLNNTLENLRVVSPAENYWNADHKGYHFNKRAQKYIAVINANGKHTYLGSHATPEEAHAAYLQAKEQLHLIGLEPAHWGRLSA